MIFTAATLSGAGVVAYKIQRQDQSFLLPGDTSHGHHQIEIACSACHTPMEGVLSDACIECHGAELDAADDSHPAAKFRDPRNADRLQKLNAIDCVTCHVEHRPDATLAMGVTLPTDYCRRCHDDIAEERPTHEGLGFETCVNAGCHNFHDNRALNEVFLADHVGEPAHLDGGLLPMLGEPAAADAGAPALPSVDAPPEHQTAEAIAEWADSGHAGSGVSCMDCHAAGAAEGSARGPWVERPTLAVCGHCHGSETRNFWAGKHGMRLAQDMAPMAPSDAKQPMEEQAHDTTLGCSTCHGSHAVDRGKAAVSACLGCHADEHSKAYVGSPHHALFEAELRGEAPAGSGVSCASCHMPRVQDTETFEMTVMHNQNDNLRPNEKMVRPVCGECHGVAFTLNALADRVLIDRNFDGTPSTQVDTFEFLRRKRGETP